MFWKKKYIHREAFGIGVDVSVGSDDDWVMRMLEKASALQDQNRRDYNDLYMKINLILDHLKLRYVPEKESTEPARLEEKKSEWQIAVENISWAVSGGGETSVSHKPTPKKKRKYVKSGKYKK